jgi:hypothetical protein
MTRRATTGGNGGKARRRSTKSRHSGRPRASSAELQKQLREQARELAEARRQQTEAREQQAATADILRIISASPSKLQAVLEAVVRSAARFCKADDVTIFELDGRTYVRWPTGVRSRKISVSASRVRAGMSLAALLLSASLST